MVAITFSRSWGGITLLLILGLETSGQTFNLRHHPHGANSTSSTGWSIEQASGQFIVFGNANYFDSIFYSSVVTSVVVDGMGNVTMVDRVVDPMHATYPGWSNGADKLTGGGFVIGGGNFRTDSMDNWIQRPVLYFFSANGEYDSFIELGPEDQEWIGRQAKQTSDGGFVICGDAAISNQTDGFVIKTDPLGQQEWVQTYGGNLSDYINSLGLRAGGGYFSGGQYMSYASRDLWVQALDDTGSVIWDKVWGSPFNEPNAHLTTANDGHPLIASGYAQNANDHLRHYLAKLNALDGEIIWQRQFGASSVSSAFYVVQEIAPGGDLIAAGGHRASSQTYGAMLRTTSTGDSLWMRYYQYSDSIVSDKQGLFRDVQPTPDGGFIACGTALAVPGIYSQDIWVVKVDEHGCIEPGCQIITGMETQITNMRDVLRVWPNPASSAGQVQVQIKLPESFVPQGDLRITITSSDGRLVHEQAVPLLLGRGAGGEGNAAGISLSHSFTLSLSQLSPGLYHLHLSDAPRWISGAKLVVE